MLLYPRFRGEDKHKVARASKGEERFLAVPTKDKRDSLGMTRGDWGNEERTIRCPSAKSARWGGVTIAIGAEKLRGEDRRKTLLWRKVGEGYDARDKGRSNRNMGRPWVTRHFNFQAGEKSSGGLEDEFQAIYQS